MTYQVRPGSQTSTLAITSRQNRPSSTNTGPSTFTVHRQTAQTGSNETGSSGSTTSGVNPSNDTIPFAVPVNLSNHVNISNNELPAALPFDVEDGSTNDNVQTNNADPDNLPVAEELAFVNIGLFRGDYRAREGAWEKVLVLDGMTRSKQRKLKSMFENFARENDISGGEKVTAAYFFNLFYTKSDKSDFIEAFKDANNNFVTDGMKPPLDTKKQIKKAMKAIDRCYSGKKKFWHSKTRWLSGTHSFHAQMLDIGLIQVLNTMKVPEAENVNVN